MVMKKVTELRNKVDAMVVSAMMKKRDGGAEIAAFVVLALVVIAVAGDDVMDMISGLVTTSGTAIETAAQSIIPTS